MMKVSKRTVVKIGVGLLLAVAMGLLFLYPRPYRNLVRLMKAEVERAQQRKVILLSETDHQALLEACRKLSREVNQGNLLAPERYMVRREPDPEVAQFPQAILDLEPMFVETETDGRIRVGMMGGIHHYGVIAYPENYEKPRDDFEFGDKKMIDGLWYYEDGYNPKYDKWVERQLRKDEARRN